MERAKKARTPFRTALTKTINEIELELKKDDKDLELLREKLLKLESLEAKLVETDAKVLDEMLNASADEDLYQAEHDSQEKYQDDTRRTKLAINRIFQPGNPSGSILDAASVGGSRTRSFKLPKIEMKKFSGELKEWLGWWAQFEKIDEDEELCATDKFQYLLQATTEGTRARRLVEGYPQSAANYPKVIEAMKDRFGDKTLLTEFYVRQLARLVIANATKSKGQGSLGFMYDELESSLRALESLGVTKDQGAAFLYPLVESSLPTDLIKVWQRSPLSGYVEEEEQAVEKRLESLMKFLKQEVKGAERLSFVQAGIDPSSSSSRNTRKQYSDSKSTLENAPTAAGLFVSEKTACIFCEKAHESRECNKAINMTLEAKKSIVESSRCCFACLKPRHGIKKCKAFIKCPVCDKRHLIILCPELSKVRNSSTGRNNHENPKTSRDHEVQTTVSSVSCSGSVYLQTLRIRLRGPKREKVVRALIDSGSQRSYILNSTALELGIATIGQQPLIHTLFGGHSTNAHMHNVHDVKAESVCNDNSMSFKLLGHEKICGHISRIVQGPWMKILKAKKIWINDLGPGPLEIEVLFGADVMASLMLSNSVIIDDGLMAANTRLGWTIMGSHNDHENHSNLSALVVNSYLSTTEVSNLWKLEAIGISDPVEVLDQKTKDERAKQSLLETITRKSNGTYVIRLPWITTPQAIPSNKNIAVKRLESTTSKLRNSDKMMAYGEIFESWLKEGLIEIAHSIDAASHYLPHRPVFKPESITTPIRPVFDASCKVGRNPSLNQCLEKGPNLIEFIPSIINRFRRYKIGCVADIRKAYQTIEVRDEDRDFLRFLWWTDDGSLMTYRHCKVVFGVNCSGFILGAVIEHHLNQVTEDQKSIANKLLQSLYVDNSVTSLDSFEDFEIFRDVSTSILASANMELRQWEHTSVEGSRVGLLLGNGCGLESGRRVSSSTPSSLASTVLGIKWNKKSDTLSCDIPKLFIDECKITKRVILSTVAKLFDPMGFVCPALITPKLILQEAWIQNQGWDEELPAETISKFLEWTKSLELLSKVQVPRHAFKGESKPGTIQLHIFSDASKYAYSAAVFVRMEGDKGIEVQLLQAKSRLAPIKNPTIPRLELMGCLIATRLCKTIEDSLDLHNFPKYYWTDSSVALAWIQRNNEWGTFIGNRVKEINSLSKSENWRHIPGEHNPADLPSRGCTPSFLIQSRWWEGPHWLKKNIEDWPVGISKPDEIIIHSELKKSACISLFAKSSIIPWYLERHSSYEKNLRLFAMVKRFVNKSKKLNTETGNLTVQELIDAEMHMFRLVQLESFPINQEVIEGLRVIQSPEGLYKVITKLFNRQDTDEFKSPIILPHSHVLVDQLVTHHHQMNGHAGVQWLISNLRERVWIIKSRRVIKSIVNRCVICRRFAMKPSVVPAAPLPENRVRNSVPFEITGVDLAGPLYMKNQTKAWIVIFTCAVYRAVHFEMVQSLSTESFLLVFQKFVCRRGRPVTIYSDNGTNFHGADNLFKTLSWEEIQKYAATRRIVWKFNPPSAAWWGGWWERLIRYAKDILRKMLGFRKISGLQLESLLCEVESTMNSRPLTYISDDLGDLIPLTPQMFLSHQQQTSFPEAAEIDENSLRLSYKALSKLRTELRARFRREYLSQLVHRGKSRKTTEFKEGDIVLIGDDHKKRIFWPMGKILELIPGADGKTRVARIRVKGGELIRPLQRIYPLEVSSSKEVPSISKDIVDKAKDAIVQEEVETDTVTRRGRRVKKPVLYPN